MKKQVNYIIYFLSLVVIVELILRLFLSIPLIANSNRFGDDYFDRRQWVNKHKDNSAILHKQDVYSPTLGWVSKPNLRDVTIPVDKVLNTNSRGLRGKIDYPLGKNHSKKRILIVGDSFTFGDEVSDTETFSYYLQEMLPDYEVINMGMHGYGHDQMLLLLREEGVKYEPDIIILGFISADMFRNRRTFRGYAKPKFMVDGGELKLTGSPVPSPEAILRWDWIRPRIFDVSMTFLEAYKRLFSFTLKEAEIITKHILDEFVEVARSVNAEPVFVFLPYGPHLTADTPRPESEIFLLEYCQENIEVRCHSSRPYFLEKARTGTEFKKDGHWRPTGHHVAAESIYQYLMNAHFIDPE